ncbi:MAG: hypothetical protein K0Q59_2986, partial [Paenibacillus sp.]|nr:hypothetical protein [Paenibacillus sp.]
MVLRKRVVTTSFVATLLAVACIGCSGG